MLEIEMGHLWSEDVPIARRERFESWNAAELVWEILLKVCVCDTEPLVIVANESS